VTDEPNIPDENIPESLPNEAGKRRILAIYSRLGALRHELKDCSSTDITAGNLLTQYQSSLDELATLTGRDFDGFMPNSRTTDDHNLECLSVDLRIAVGTLIEELRSEFAPEQLPYYSPPVQPPSTTTINNSATAQADVQQTTELEVKVFNDIKVELGAKLDELKANYTEGSKEHSFLTRLKAGLDAVRSVAGVLPLAYSTAQAVGLSEHDLHLLLKSLGLA
jgi:hypothetical protein